MKIKRNDAGAVTMAAAAVGVFVVASAGWGVPLIGDSNRWASVLILLLGLAAAELSAPGKDKGTGILAALVIAGFLFAVLALATGSLAALALLVSAVVALVAVSAWHHARDRSRQSAPAAPVSAAPRP